MKKRYFAGVVFLLSFLFFITSNFASSNEYKRERNIKYYPLSSPQLILKKGEQGAFDSQRTHTMSILELNRDGYKYWAYYHGFDGKNIRHDMGIAYSNDLINWKKASDVPVIPNLRWGTVVVVDGTVHMFGTRNYGSGSYIVRLTSEDGKDFNEQEVVVAAADGERHQNPFIFYDENKQTYRLYYYHYKDGSYNIEEKHSGDITQICNSKANKVLSDNRYILAAPSMMYRDGKYWLAAETLHEVKGEKVWKTIIFASRHPYSGFAPVSNHEILVNNDACYFQHIFDNRLYGIYSHKEDDGTWNIFSTTHDFVKKNLLKLEDVKYEMKAGEERQIKAVCKFNDEAVKDVTSAATWTISDNSVALIHKGTIKCIKSGSVTVTALYGGASATADISVRQGLLK